MRVTPAGKTIFIVQRRYAGKPIRAVLGHWPEMAVLQARKAAREAKKADSVRDLHVAPVAAPVVPLFDDWADKWLHDHVRVKLKPMTQRDYEKIATALKKRFAAFGKFVFAGRDRDTPYQNLSAAWIDTRKLAKLKDVRLYYAWHTFASETAKAGHNLPMIGALSGHSLHGSRDGQSVKTTGNGSVRTYDAGKMIKDGKRHILTSRRLKSSDYAAHRKYVTIGKRNFVSTSNPTAL